MSAEVRISDSLWDGILSDSIEIAGDIEEVFIEDIFENDLVKDIPVVRSISLLMRVGYSMNQRFFAKKLLSFIKEFKEISLSETAIEFKAELDRNKKKRHRVLETILVFNERYSSKIKSKISAQLFAAYLERNISYDEFNSLHMSLDSLHIDCIDAFETLREDIDIYAIGPGRENVREKKGLILASGLAESSSDFHSSIRLNKYGKMMLEYGLSKINF